MVPPSPPQSLEDVYRACAPVAARRAIKLLGSSEEAWDLVHDVFVRLAQAGMVDRIRHDPMAFLYRAVTNACLDALEARRVRAEPLPPGDGCYECEPAVVARNLLARLADRLDPMDREILVLAYFDELPQEDIAQILGVWRRTVGRRLARLRELAAAMGAES